MEKSQIMRDSLVEIFDIPDQIQAEQLRDYFLSELKKRGFEKVGNHGTGWIYFTHAHFHYGIWPSGYNEVAYGVSGPVDTRIRKRSGQHIHVTYRDIDYLDEFLENVRIGIWDCKIKKALAELKKIEEKEGERAQFYNVWL
jgi:hypothetical protein